MFKKGKKTSSSPPQASDIPRQDSFDASASPAESGKAPAPRNITETKAWKTSSQGASRLWGNYLKILKDSFNNMTREQQEELLMKFSIILTMGVAVILLVSFYGFLPSLLRIFILPAAFIAAFLAGKNIVTPVMIGRFQSILKR